MTLLKPHILKLKSFLLTLLAFGLSSGASYAAGSKKMFSLDNTDFVVLISFLLFVGILIYFKVPTIIAKLLDKRSHDIKNEIERLMKCLTCVVVCTLVPSGWERSETAV